MSFDPKNKVTWSEMTASLKSVFDVTTANTSKEASERSAKDVALNKAIDDEIATRKERFEKLKNIKIGSAISKVISEGLQGQIVKIDIVNKTLYADDWFKTCRIVDTIPEFNTEKTIAPSAYNTYGTLDISADYIINLQNDRYYQWNGTIYVEKGRVHDFVYNKTWLYNPRTNHYEFYNYWNRYDRIVTYKDGYVAPPLITNINFGSDLVPVSIEVPQPITQFSTDLINIDTTVTAINTVNCYNCGSNNTDYYPQYGIWGYKIDIPNGISKLKGFYPDINDTTSTGWTTAPSSGSLKLLSNPVTVSSGDTIHVIFYPGVGLFGSKTYNFSNLSVPNADFVIDAGMMNNYQWGYLAFE